VATLGCKVNQYDSALLSEALSSLGFRPIPFGAEADCFIVNTCTVTERTDYQSRQLLRRALRANPRAMVVATGCYAQTRASDLIRIPGITLIAGNREKGDLPKTIATLWQRKVQGLPLEPEVLVSPCATDLPEAIRSLDRFPDHTRAFLKIQDGCNAFCSYCIVPYARGRSRSLAPGEVLERLFRLARGGFQEVVLTGIHLGAYGQDQHPPTDLARLLRSIETERPVGRLRLSSIEPREITDGLLSVLSDARTLCPHLHIPLQSGDDRVLGLMNRHYDRGFFSDTVQRILSARPDTALGLDVMAGFPGEDEGAFEKTCELIDSLPIAYLHVFPFSCRPGTRAAEMNLQVRAEEKKGRAGRLRLLGERKRQVFMERFVGRPLRVLVEGGRPETNGPLKGFSEHYLPVALSGGGPELVNRVVTVVARGIARGMLQAEGYGHG